MCVCVCACACVRACVCVCVCAHVCINHGHVFGHEDVLRDKCVCVVYVYVGDVNVYKARKRPFNMTTRTVYIQL